jgi:outer membrane protein TolC
MKIPGIAFFLSIFCFIIQAQPMLNPEEAIKIALKNHYDILIAQNDADIAKANNTAGNAGMLPTIDAEGSVNYSQENLDQKSSTGIETKSPNANSNTINAGAFLNWTLFDGGKMFVTKRKLSEIESLGAIQFKDKVLQTVYDVTVAYYDVVRQKQQLASINEVITYNEELVKILQTSFNAGLSPKNSLLQAQIDLNVYKENAINQKAIITAAKRTLNELLSRETNTDFEVSDSIPLSSLPDKNNFAQKLDSANTSILSLKKQVEIARLSLREFSTLRFPRISFNAGFNAAYNYTQNNNTAGSLLKNNSYGPIIGGTIIIPLYQSGNINRQITTAKLELQSENYNLESIKLQVNIQLENALTQYENQEQLLKIEKDNDALAKENVEISIQRLRYGQTNALEIRQAQASYVDSRTRLINFEFNLKVAETKLKQLLSEL